MDVQLPIDDPEHAKFGVRDGNSRWFVGEPNILETAVVPVRQRWMCPVKDCTGEMVYNGSAWGTRGQDRGWHHTCGVCGFTAALKEIQYPRVFYKEVQP